FEGVFGEVYKVDATITNSTMHPLILLDVKFNRNINRCCEKASVICASHTSIRRKYLSIRNSVAILIGSWDESSIKMLDSHNVIPFVVPIDHIEETLADFNIEFCWNKKDLKTPWWSWFTFYFLRDEEKQ